MQTDRLDKYKVCWRMLDDCNNLVTEIIMKVIGSME